MDPRHPSGSDGPTGGAVSRLPSATCSAAPPVGSSPSVDASAYRASGWQLIPLHPHDKRPRDADWTTRTYTDEDIDAAIGDGCNVGARPSELQAVIDYDPRNDPDGRGLAALRELHPSIDASPCVVTGGGGFHWYHVLEAPERLLNSVDELPGVEIKGKGRQVVAAGSVHPDTGRRYVWSYGSAPLQWAPPLPQVLRERFRRQRIDAAPTAAATIDLERAVALLNLLDPVDFAQHERWLEAGMAFWHATGGSREGYLAFDAWSARDELYDTDTHQEQREERWSTWAPKPGEPARTVGSLIHFATEAGGGAAVAEILRPTSAELREMLPDLPSTPPVAEPDDVLDVIDAGDVPDEAELQPMETLVPNFAEPELLTVVGGAGGDGKTILALLAAIGTALGVPFGHWTPTCPARVLLISAEDPLPRIERRMLAALRKLGISRDDLRGKLSIYAPTRYVLLERKLRGAAPERTPEYARLVRTVQRGGYRAVFLDPMVKLGSGLEETNQDHEAMALALTDLARTTSCAVVLVHHARKGGESGSVDNLRGGSALAAAARVVLITAKMTKKDPAFRRLTPTEQRHFGRYTCVYAAKSNHGETDPSGKWMRIEPVTLLSGEVVPAIAAVSLAAPDVEDSAQHRDAVLAAVRDAGRSESRLQMHGRRGSRACDAIAAKLAIPEATAAALIDDLIAQGWLYSKVGWNAKRNEVQQLWTYDEVGEAAPSRPDDVEAF